MAKLVSEVVTLARQSVNDATSKRFSATEALRIFNRTMHRLYTERPSLFVGALTAALTDKALTDTVPYEDQFAQLHADMMASEMETTPDEDSSPNRQAFFDTRSRR